MEERKPDVIKLAPPSLKAAIRRARVESAEQGEAVAELRQAELVRLELLEEAIKPVLAQVPDGVELFDAGIAHGERPRLFLDMIGFVDLGHDRRTYRFFQDTRHGRVLIAESENIDRVVSAVTNYVARRLVEREQALASDWRGKSEPGVDLKATTRAKKLVQRANVEPTEKPPAEAPRAAPPKRSLGTVLADLFSFLLMTLGSITLCAALFFGAWAGWIYWAKDFWAAHIGTPPF